MNLSRPVKSWRSRSAGRVAVLVVVAAMAVACGSSGNSASSGGASSKNVTLTIWNWGTVAPVLKKLDTQFEAANPGVTIKLVTQPLNSYSTLVQSAIAVRSGPDIIETFAQPSVFDYYKGLLPLNKFVTPQVHQTLTGWAPVSTSLSDTGVPYAVPYLGQGFVWYYNKKLFAAAGLNPSEPPASWTALMSDCRALKAKGITPISAGFKDGYMGEDYVSHFAALLMSKPELASFGGQQKWNSPQFIQAWNLIKQLYGAGCFTPESGGVDMFPDSVNQFSASKGAMFYGLGGDIANFAAFKPTLGNNLGVWNGPNVPGSTYAAAPADFAPNLAWGITRWSKSAALDYKWIMFVTSAKSEDLAWAIDGALPNNIDSKPTSQYQPAQQVLALATSANRFTDPDFYIRSTVEATLDRVIPEIVTGQITPAAGMATVQQTEQSLPAIPSS
jgi:raffinose/stachyose/melibiose transport system substrate-binding protein